MFHVQLDSDGAYLVLSPRWADLDPAWHVAALALALLVPAMLIVWLYRYELRLVRGLHATGLLSLRGLALLVLWLLVAFQPTLARFTSETPPSRVAVAVDVSGSMDVIDPHTTPEERAALASRLGGMAADAQRWPRKEIARRVLSSDGLNLLERLGERHQVELSAFDDARRDAAEEDLGKTGSARGTDLRHGLAAGRTQGSGPLLGVILLTDGRHTAGPSPVEAARELGGARVPVYPVLIGPGRPPPDLLLLDVQAPTKAFKGTTVPVTARFRATGLAAQELTAEVLIDGKPLKEPRRKVVKHDGTDREYSAEFQVPADEAGTHSLQVRVSVQRGPEVSEENNRRERVFRVADDKSRVLVIDGDARWEHHYLASALRRDPTVKLDRVLFAPPRLGLVPPEKRDEAGLPRTKLPEPAPDAKDPLADYDCVVLGDVLPEQLPRADRLRLARYVSDRGGTLILSAGKRSLPLAFLSESDDPLVKMLPLREPRVLASETGFLLKPSAQGKLAPFLQLDPDSPPGTWPALPKHFWAVIGTPKPGASVLAIAEPDEAAKAKDADPLMLQQNYGFGRVVFVGVDSTWRWRFKVGDAYHHRFWGQLVRWAAAEKLLPAGNRFVRYGTGEPVYQPGQEAELLVRLSEDTPPLKPGTAARAKVLRKKPGGDEVAAVVPLSASATQNRLLEGKVRDLPTGGFVVELDIPELAGKLAPDGPVASFSVLGEENSELRDLATDPALLQSLAEQSKGRVFTPEDVELVLGLLARKVQPVESRHESKPWQDEPLVWWVLALLVTLLSLEWAWRKRLDLP